MRIAIDYTPAINQAAGIGRLVRCLVSALAEIDHDNAYVLLYATPPPHARPHFPSAPNFTRRQIRLSERQLTILWHRLGLRLPVDWLTGPVDIFHAPDFVLPPVRTGKRVVTVHDLAFLLRPECAEASLRSYLEQTVPRSVRQADMVVADSENTRNDVICLLGVAPERVEVVHAGVEKRFHPPADDCKVQEVRNRLGLDRPFILSVGVIEPRKDLPTLVRAYNLLRSRLDIPHLLALAGGRGWLADDTFRQAELSPYRRDIRFLGFVPDEDLPELYAAADLFVYPSIYEGFGLPPLEAMACGTPVVTSNAASLPEVVGEAGLMVEPGDVEGLAEAMEQVLCHADLRDTMRQRGIARASSFTWEAAAERLLAVYQRVADLGC